MNSTSQLAHPQRAGVYHLPLGGLADIELAAWKNDYAVFRVDLRGASSKQDALHCIAKALSFPASFGANFDALADCLGDMSWRPAEGYVIVLEHCDGLHGRAEQDFVDLIQIFSAAAEEWREQGKAFWCFVGLQADGIAWLPTMA